MNAMSSRAKTFVGSAIATASELPIFRTGMTSYFLAVGAGTRRRTAGSISSWASVRSEEHTSVLQSQFHLVCRLLLEKKKNNDTHQERIDAQRPQWPADSDEA